MMTLAHGCDKKARKENGEHENDMARLREMGDYLRRCFRHDLMPEADLIAAPEGEKGHEAACLASDDGRFYFPSGSGLPIDIRVQWNQPRDVRYAVIREHLPLSQRIESFELWAGRGEDARIMYRGTTVGNKKIVRLENCRTDTITLRITDSREKPAPERLAFYD